MLRTLLALALLALASGCAPTPATESKNLAPSVTDYPLVGVVRNVEPEKGRVTIKHEAITGFMRAMTMPFTLKNPADLDDVRAGDEIEATLRVEREGEEIKDYTLMNLVVSKPAPAQPLSLNLSGEKATLTPLPKVLAPGDLVPDFAMTDEDGHPLTLSDFRGDVVALTFIFTGCPLPDFCPRMDRKFAQVADQIHAKTGRGEQIRLLSVSFDPEHDTPAVLKAHAKRQGANPPLWRFAVASHAELGKVAPALGLSYGPVKDGIMHNLVIAVIGPDRRLIKLERGEAARSWETADLLKTIYSGRSKSQE